MKMSKQKELEIQIEILLKKRQRVLELLKKIIDEMEKETFNESYL